MPAQAGSKVVPAEAGTQQVDSSRRTRDGNDSGIQHPARELRLMERVQERWGALISQTCRDPGLGVRDSGPCTREPRTPNPEPRFFLPPDFLAALIANESGGNPVAVRFEAGVYRHLVAVVGGAQHAYGSLTPQEINEEIEEALQVKTNEFHARFLTENFVETARRAVSTVGRSDILRELATSWGLTQIMGYHMVGRPGTPADLAKPEVNLGVAHELLAAFAEDYRLDPQSQFEELFRCWNTGRPYGPPRGPATCDPDYVAKGLARMALYAASAKEFLR